MLVDMIKVGTKFPQHIAEICKIRHSHLDLFFTKQPSQPLTIVEQAGHSSAAADIQIEVLSPFHISFYIDLFLNPISVSKDGN